jgi:UTP:GlnB (protein PII) uridylyltransferase
VSPPGGVAGLAEAAATSFPHIPAARTATEHRLRERREQFASVIVDDDATVVLTGSWGRCEITSESDDDFMVLFEGPTRAGVRPSVEEAAEVLGQASGSRGDLWHPRVA